MGARNMDRPQKGQRGAVSPRPILEQGFQIMIYAATVDMGLGAVVGVQSDNRAFHQLPRLPYNSFQ